MSKSALRFLAVFLSLMIVVVLFAGLDDLPRGVRARIESERVALADARNGIQRARGEIAKEVEQEPDLFRPRGLHTALTARLDRAGEKLARAEEDAAALAVLSRKNSRRDTDEAERRLAEEHDLRTAAAAGASAAQAEADRWVERKRNLPREIEHMESERDALRSADLSAVAAAVARAENDWPEKKRDLENRLAALRGIPADAEKTWIASEPVRRQALAGDVAHLDFDALARASSSLDGAAASLPQKSNELKGLAGQLYDSWEKVLVDLDTRRHGLSHDYLEKLKIVRTHVTDPSSKKGDTASEEKWVEVSKADYSAAERNLGMALEHKPAGKYDSEAERVPQPAGFAFIAPPSQGSNEYGRWERRDGQSFWVFYGQYALLRDLLFNRGYQPPSPGEYDEYRTLRRSSQTYYGHDETASGAPKYGTNGSVTRPQYSGSRYARRAGGYRGSEYEPRAYRRQPQGQEAWPSRGSDHGRSFGRTPAPRRSAPLGGRGFGRGRR